MASSTKVSLMLDSFFLENVFFILIPFLYLLVIVCYSLVVYTTLWEGFMFASAGPRRFQVFHFGISISYNNEGVKLDSIFMHGPTGDEHRQLVKIFFFFPTLSLKR